SRARTRGPSLARTWSEAALIGAGYENPSSRCRHRSPPVPHSSLWNPFHFQFVHHSERHLPGDVASTQIDGIQSAPRRLLARVVLIIPKARVRSPLASPHVRLGRTCRLRFHLPHGAHLIHVDEKIATRGIEGSPRPRGASKSTRII